MSNVNLDKFLNIVSDEKVDSIERAKARQKRRKHLRASQHIALHILRQLDLLGWSQKKLAQNMGVSPQLVNKWVKGNENFTLETLYNLGECLNIELIEIKSISEDKEIADTSSMTSSHYERTAKIIKFPVRTGISQTSPYNNQPIAR